jgi:hypothetical protein
MPQPYENNPSFSSCRCTRWGSALYDGEGRQVQQTVGVNVTTYLLDTQPGLAMVLAVLEKRNICPDKCSAFGRKCVLYWKWEPPGIGAAADAGGG